MRALLFHGIAHIEGNEVTNTSSSPRRRSFRSPWRCTRLCFLLRRDHLPMCFTLFATLGAKLFQLDLSVKSPAPPALSHPDSPRTNDSPSRASRISVRAPRISFSRTVRTSGQLRNDHDNIPKKGDTRRRLSTVMSTSEEPCSRCISRTTSLTDTDALPPLSTNDLSHLLTRFFSN